LTVTPSAAISSASVFRNAVRPVRAVLERISAGIGWRTATEVIATIRPQPRSRISGTACRQAATAGTTSCASAVS